MEFLRSFVRNHFAWKPVVVSRNVGFSLKLLLNISFTTWASDGYHALMVHCSDSLLAEVSHGQRRRRWDRETSRGLHTFFITHPLAFPWEPVTFQSRAIQLAEPVCVITTFIRARTFHLKRNQFWKPGSFHHKRGRWLHERMRRRPAEVCLFPIIFLLPWETFVSREW